MFGLNPHHQIKVVFNTLQLETAAGQRNKCPVKLFPDHSWSVCSEVDLVYDHHPRDGLRLLSSVRDDDCIGARYGTTIKSAAAYSLPRPFVREISAVPRLNTIFHFWRFDEMLIFPRSFSPLLRAVYGVHTKL